LIHEYGEEKVYATTANTNNHIGVPLNLLKLMEKHKFAVIELGTNHPGEIDLLASITIPDIAIITSIGPAHLEYFKNLDGVAHEKSSIFNYFHPGSNKYLAIIPENILKYEPVREALFKKKYLTFSTNSTTSFITYNPISASIKNSTFELIWNNIGIKQTSTWNILGNHQLENASAAAAAATHIGIKPENIAKHLQKCRLTGMRMRVREVNGITIINDAYNANPTSMAAGIKWLQSIVVRPLKNNYFVVFGDMFELGDKALKAHIDILNLAIEKLYGCHIVTIGSIMKEAIYCIKKEKELTDVNIINLPDSEKGAFYIIEKAKSGDIIYLKGSRRNKLEKIDESFKAYL
jgi:UDP-N-acetylmuramoyl-tripeptide--D-alanyl-D-alanine ligase